MQAGTVISDRERLLRLMEPKTRPPAYASPAYASEAAACKFHPCTRTGRAVNSNNVFRFYPVERGQMPPLPQSIMRLRPSRCTTTRPCHRFADETSAHRKAHTLRW
jgi:hypothetical protein